MSLRYKTRWGLDWPDAMSDVLIDLTIGKKWRQIQDVYGVEVKDPWVPMLDAAKSLLPEDMFRVSEWTEQHFHDWVMFDKLITWGCASSSKALLLNEPLMFKDHIGTVAEAEVGKEVATSTGGTAKILAVHNQINAPLYRVGFGDGTETICSEDHLWAVRIWGRDHYEGQRGNRKGVYGYVTKVRSAKELAAWKPGSLKRRRACVPLTAPVAFSTKDVPIDPYLLGCWLGDGCVTGGSVGFTSHPDDRQIVVELRRRLNRDFPELSFRQLEKTSDYRIVHERKKGENRLATALKSLGLWNARSATKFVPGLYKVNDLDTRLDVLAGLMDTDGYVDTRGSIYFSTASERLADDVKWMLQSIGACVKTTVYKTGYKKNGVFMPCKDSYSLSVQGLPLDMKRRLFKLDRKRSRLKDNPKMQGYKSIDYVTLVENREDYPPETRCITLAERDSEGRPVNGLFPIGNFTVTHNSNDTGLLMLLDWLVDPYDTVTLLGSTTLVDLKSRSWEAVERYHHALQNNKLGLIIPGRISRQGQKLVNIGEDDNSSSFGEKAGIQGRAINEGGRLQGAHAKYVRLVVDELAEISNHDAIKTAMANLRIGTIGFKFVGLANPESWDNPSCQYCEPIQGRDKVNVDTGSWTSTFGCFVRHHDGLKSPCVLQPELRTKFPFLMSKEEAESAIQEAGGNEDAPQVWKMIRGFPVPLGTMIPTVLDPKLAEEHKICDRLASPEIYPVIGVAGGIDPAWSEGGDGAYRSRVIVRNVMGKPILDFSDGLSRMTISATDPRPVTKQLRDQVIDFMRRPGLEPQLKDTAIDSSGNQGLADDLDIVLSSSSLHVNSSQRASELPMRATDQRKAKEIVYDRGTEAWAVLAEFCRAGMVKGLPKEVRDQITQRRYACRAGTTTQMFPLRMESKELFRTRIKKSPDETDACALAALAVKERLGIIPFSFVNERGGTVNDNAFLGRVTYPTDYMPDRPDAGEYENSFDYGAYEPI